MKIKLPRCALIALLSFQAKKDIRYYLNGICLYPEGSAAATDGHRMIYITGLDKWKGKENIIINFEQKIPTSKYDEVIIDTTKGIAQYLLNDVLMAFSLITIVGGRFPDVHRVIPKAEPQPVSAMGFNATYIDAVCKTAKQFNSRFESVKFDFFGETSPCVATVTNHEGITAKMVVMPMRL